MSKKPQVYDESGQGRRLCHACGKYTGSATATACAACGEPFATRAPAKNLSPKSVDGSVGGCARYYKSRIATVAKFLAATPDAVPLTQCGNPLWYVEPMNGYKPCQGCGVYVYNTTRICPKCASAFSTGKTAEAVLPVTPSAAARQPALGVDVLVAQRALAVVNARIARMGGEKAVSRAVSAVAQLAELCGGLDTLQEFLRISRE